MSDSEGLLSERKTLVPKTRLRYPLDASMKRILATQGDFEHIKEEETSSDTFTLFSKLPAEIRLMIWKFAQPGPRNVILKFRVVPRKGEVPGAYRENPVVSTWCRTPVPALLHVNFEARKEMKKSYRLSFGGRNYRVADARLRRSLIYFNFEKDSLVLESNELESVSMNYPRRGTKNRVISRGLGPDRTKLRRLILVDYYRSTRYDYQMLGWAFELEMFKALEHISYVVCPVEKIFSDLQVNELSNLGNHSRFAIRTVEFGWLRGISFYPGVDFPTLSVNQVVGHNFEALMNERIAVKAAERIAMRSAMYRSEAISMTQRVTPRPRYLPLLASVFKLVFTTAKLAFTTAIFLAYYNVQLRRGFQ